ncbi:MAG: transposase, partial [Hyphomicrobiaceae bacterium]|nr:transposase [Hyphomicrobiaceae bacterium]
MDDSANLHALIAELRREIAVLKQENAELRRRLELDSSNSSKPPSSDGPAKQPRTKKPRNKSLRGKSDKNSGGQKGHKGNTLRQSETPDKVEHHKVCACEHCHTKLDTSNVINVEKRQVFDMPEPKLGVTEHWVDISKCSKCGKITKATFPEGVNAPAQYGPRIKATAVYFNVQQLVPEDRSAAIMGDLFAAPTLCPASITAWVDKKANDFEPVVETIKQQLKRDPVRHLDETGFRIGGKTQWL